MSFKSKSGLFLIAGLFFAAFPVFAFQSDSDGQLLHENDLMEDGHIIYITDQWKYKAGDDPEYAKKNFDDSGWEQISTYLTAFDFAFAEWQGIGWFRLNVTVDSTLVDKPLALLIEKHLGASEFYLNGEKKFNLGKVSVMPELAESYTDFKPRIIVFSEPGEHSIAVRYANSEPGIFIEESGMAGFRFLLGDAEYHMDSKFENALWRSGWQSFFLGSLLVFGVIHLLIFSFYPIEKRNLYFAFLHFFWDCWYSQYLKLKSQTLPMNLYCFPKLP